MAHFMKRNDGMISRFYTMTALALVTILTMTAAAHASEPESIGTFGDWKAYRFMEGGNQVCYMAATPQKAEGKYTTRGDVYALITHRPAENTKDVFSYIAGYPYKDGSAVKLTIDGKAFSLFTQDETAWAADANGDAALAAALKSGSKMVVKGTSRKGTETTDTYGLSGSTAAYDAISKACGL
jgi:hypothetical protein